MTELKPCPFCGFDKPFIHQFQTNFFGFRYQVICDSCGCRGKPCETQENAADVWNMRSKKVEDVGIFKLRGDNELNVTSPWFPGASHVKIDVVEKIDTGIYGSIEYFSEEEYRKERGLL